MPIRIVASFTGPPTLPVLGNQPGEKEREAGFSLGVVRPGAVAETDFWGRHSVVGCFHPPAMLLPSQEVAAALGGADLQAAPAGALPPPTSVLQGPARDTDGRTPPSPITIQAGRAVIVPRWSPRSWSPYRPTVGQLAACGARSPAPARGAAPAKEEETVLGFGLDLDPGLGLPLWAGASTWARA